MTKTIKSTYDTFEQRAKLVDEGYCFIVVSNAIYNSYDSRVSFSIKVDIDAFTDLQEAQGFLSSLNDLFGAKLISLKETKLKMLDEARKKERHYIVFQEKLRRMNITEEEFQEAVSLAEDKVREARRLLKNAYANLQFYYDIEDYRRIAKNLK